MTPERVLLVDDEVEFVAALSERLETRGLVVETADSGPKALAKIREARFDAVVLDLAMPGMDGIQTLRAMRDHNPDLQVILLTGHATLQKGIEAVKLGAIDFMEKPAAIEVLVERIRQARATSAELTEKKTDRIIKDILATKGW